MHAAALSASVPTRRPQELVDEMEKLLAASVSEKERLQKMIHDEQENSKMKILRLNKERDEKETRNNAMAGSLRKQLDEERAKQREMHEQLVTLLEEKEALQKKLG